MEPILVPLFRKVEKIAAVVEAINQARIIGRILRLALGVFFMTEVWPVYREVTTEGALIRAGWAIGLIVIYYLLHLIISRSFSSIPPVVGSILAFSPFLLVFFVGYGGPAATGALTFLAIALILAAIRGDSGCEVMSIPAMITRKHTHLSCLLFSPIDWCESKFHN